MLQLPGPADEAEMRQEFRRLYHKIGHAGCLQVLYEILKGGEWLSEIMLEERTKEQSTVNRNCNCTALSVCDFHKAVDRG